MEKFEISLRKISEKEFYLSPNEGLKLNEKNLKLGFAFQFKGKNDSDLIELIVTIVFIYSKAKIEKELLKFKTSFEFELQNSKKFVTINQELNNIKIPDNIAGVFISTAVATTRGMLYYKTAGTFMSNYIIPLMDIRDFLVKSDEKSDTLQK